MYIDFQRPKAAPKARIPLACRPLRSVCLTRQKPHIDISFSSSHSPIIGGRVPEQDLPSIEPGSVGAVLHPLAQALDSWRLVHQPHLCHWSLCLRLPLGLTSISGGHAQVRALDKQDDLRLTTGTFYYNQETDLPSKIFSIPTGHSDSSVQMTLLWFAALLPPTSA